MGRSIPNHRKHDRSVGLYLLCQCAMSVWAKTTHFEEENRYRRMLDADDRALVDKEVAKHPHLLEDKRSHLYNPVTGQIAPDYVKVADSLLIGERVAECYSSSLPGGFHAPISCPIKTMGDAMKSKRNPGKPAIDLENIFVRLMMIGQRRHIELGPLLDYELSAVPASLVD